jgi:hypothetical protein
MNGRNSYKNVSVFCIENTEAMEANQRYFSLISWLGENHAKIFSAENARRKNYVVALWSKDQQPAEPELRYFWWRWVAMRFLRKHREAAMEYRYSDNIEFLL